MKKTAQLLKDHMDGKKSAESNKLMIKVAKMLKEFGFSGDIQITKVSEKFRQLLDLPVALSTLKIKTPINEITEDELELVHHQAEDHLMDTFNGKVASGEMDQKTALRAYQERKELINDATDVVREHLMRRSTEEDEGIQEFDMQER